jgi:hypothetical protein
LVNIGGVPDNFKAVVVLKDNPAFQVPHLIVRMNFASKGSDKECIAMKFPLVPIASHYNSCVHNHNSLPMFFVVPEAALENMIAHVGYLVIVSL